MNKLRMSAVACAAALATILAVPPAAFAIKEMDMYRLYNPNSGEHFYTASAGERDLLKAAGWIGEGTGFTADGEESGSPVYRLYNPNGGDHHYTKSAGERDLLIEEGWSYEGIGWYSNGMIEVHRLYNPQATTGAHHYTTKPGEEQLLIEQGWVFEGLAWYALGSGRSDPNDAYKQAYVIDENTFVVGDMRFTIPAYWQGKVDLTADGTDVRITVSGTDARMALITLEDKCTLDTWANIKSSDNTVRYALPDGSGAYFGGKMNRVGDTQAYCVYKLSDTSYIYVWSGFAASYEITHNYGEAMREYIQDLYSLGTGLEPSDLFYSDGTFKPYVELWSTATHV